MNRLLDTATTAERLGISISTLYQGQAGTDRLRRVKLGAKVVFLEAEVEAFIKEKLREATRARATKLELFKKQKDIRHVVPFRRGGRSRTSAE